jgi:RimJ/RimL family protein N-acetyltransferase
VTRLKRTLFTPRLRLEPVTAELSAIANDGVGALARTLEADIPSDWVRAGLPLVRQRHAPGAWRPIRCVAVHRAEQVVVGDIRFERIRSDDEVYEIGYAIIPAYRRQGLAVEAAGRVIDWLFGEARAALVIAGCDRKNRGSVRTLRKLGFWLDGSRGSAFWWRMSEQLRREHLQKELGIKD